MLQIAPPSVMCGTTHEARCRGAAKLTSIVSTSGNGGPGRPAALNSASILPPILSTAAATASGSRRSAIWWLATFDRRVLEVEHVDLGAELGEALDRGGAHPGSTAPAHDHPLAFVAERQCHCFPL